MRALVLVLIAIRSTFAVIQYNEGEAKQLLEAAAAAYSASDKTVCLNKIFGPGTYVVKTSQEVDFGGNGKIAYYVAVSDQRTEVLVGFRGTENDEQVAAGLNPSEQFQQKHGAVNSNLNTVHGITWEKISESINDANYKNYTVVFTGYSIGGSLATLAALRTWTDKLRPTDLIKLRTYGEPRTGDHKLTTNIDRAAKNVYRVVHKADSVAHLPKCGEPNGDGCIKTNGPFHHGPEVWYNNDMEPGASHIECTLSDEDSKCSDSLGSYNFEDHRFYFGHDVAAYGKANCQDGANPVTPKAVSLLSVFLGLAIPVLFFI